MSEMNGLIYGVGTKSRSAKVHRMLYGSSSWALRPANLDSRFRFNCQKSGNCCRARSRQSNHIAGLVQLKRIQEYAESNGIIVKGVSEWPKASLDLDGSMMGGQTIAKASLVGSKGMAFVGANAAKDCQFLDGTLCRIHPVKPFICKLAPVGLIFEHLERRGRLLFAVQHKAECRECMTGREWTVREWLDDNITPDDFNAWINDMRAEANWPPLVRRKGATT